MIKNLEAVFNALKLLALQFTYQLYSVASQPLRESVSTAVYFPTFGYWGGNTRCHSGGAASWGTVPAAVHGV